MPENSVAGHLTLERFCEFQFQLSGRKGQYLLCGLESEFGPRQCLYSEQTVESCPHKHQGKEILEFAREYFNIK